MRALKKTRNLLLENIGGQQPCWIKMVEWQNNKGLATGKVYEELRPRMEPQRVFNVCWRGFLPTKYSFIMWLALRSILQTRDNLRFLDIDGNYPFCGGMEESSNYLFFSCPFSLQVWDDIHSWLGLERRTTSIRSAVKWIKRVARGTRMHSKASQIAITCTVYHIWLARNAKVFENTTESVQGTINSVIKKTMKVIYDLYPLEIL